ncbi:TPA: hypothetical protein JA361_13660 [Legionella pneumophila]|nr:hypothetical protein [Legionella pneumophila]HAT8182329.1 hypothetical protein [Legionella pneumophila]
MNNLSACPKCNSEFTYEDGMMTCPECSHEWSKKLKQQSLLFYS